MRLLSSDGEFNSRPAFLHHTDVDHRVVHSWYNSLEITRTGEVTTVFFYLHDKHPLVQEEIQMLTLFLQVFF